MEKLDDFREKIDKIDENLIQLLGERFSICLKIAEYKKKQQIPMMQTNRVQQVKDRCCEIGRRCSIDEKFVNDLYSLIIEEACRLEDEIIDFDK
ncbi:MAG: chorismate mutase family protein [Clostridium sp.]|nr:chorismate mutase family protein [Clostridium sp.]